MKIVTFVIKRLNSVYQKTAEYKNNGYMTK